MGVIGVLLGVVMDILSHYGLNPVNWGGVGEWCGVYVTSRYLYRVYMGRYSCSEARRFRMIPRDDAQCCAPCGGLRRELAH